MKNNVRSFTESFRAGAKLADDRLPDLTVAVENVEARINARGLTGGAARSYLEASGFRKGLDWARHLATLDGPVARRNLAKAEKAAAAAVARTLAEAEFSELTAAYLRLPLATGERRSRDVHIAQLMLSRVRVSEIAAEFGVSTDTVAQAKHRLVGRLTAAGFPPSLNLRKHLRGRA